MNSRDELAYRFQAQRGHLSEVAYRMLGSASEAEDAVQECWLRLERTDVSEVQNLAAWLRTVVSRVCLDMLRSRAARREELLSQQMTAGSQLPGADGDPEQEAILADSVGRALLVVLDRLGPAERIAFVLHDVFAVPFDEIAPIVERTPAATRKLASRARGRIQAARPQPDGDLSAQRAVVDAFFAAGRVGDFERLVGVLHPDVVLRGDFGGTRMRVIEGADAVAGQAKMYGGPDREVRPATVNGAAGAVIFVHDRPVSVMAFTVVGGKVAAIDTLADPGRIARLDLSAVSLR